MSCNCKSKTSCTCGSTLTGDIKYDGLGFRCEDDQQQILFEISAGDTETAIIELFASQICGLLNGFEANQDAAARWIVGEGEPAEATDPKDLGDMYLDSLNGDVYQLQLVVDPKELGDMVWNFQANINGSQWYSDAGAPLGSLGKNGDFYLRSSNGETYQKTEENGWGAPLFNLKGVAGVDGVNGTSVLTGNGVPAATLGVNGDTYLNLSTPQIDIYSKAVGVWSDTGLKFKGDTGAAGSNGTNGTDGQNFFQGTAVPDPGLGVNGDSYLNSTNGDLYLKGAGVWAVTGNIYTAPVGIAQLFNAQKQVEQSVVNINHVVQLTFSDDASVGRYDYGNTWTTDTWTSPSILANVSFKGVFNLKVTGVDGVSANDVTVTVKKNGVGIGTFTFDIPAGTANDTIIPLTFETALTAFAVDDLVVVEMSTPNDPVYGTFVGVAQVGDIFFNVQE